MTPQVGRIYHVRARRDDEDSDFFNYGYQELRAIHPDGTLEFWTFSLHPETHTIVLIEMPQRRDGE